MKALVTDAHLRSVLAGIRGLGRAGHGVLAVAPRHSAAGLWSRYTDHRAVESGADGSGFASDLEALAAGQGPAVVYPGQESTIDALLHGPLPPDLTLPYPDPAALADLRDKGRLAALAGEAGLEVPSTLIEATAGELGGWVPSFACVVKPARPNGALATAHIVESGAALQRLVAKLPGDEPLLVQERVCGPLTAVALVLDRGGTATASFQQVTRRTWPTDAGISTVAASVAPDERLTEASRRLLATAGFAGLAQLQFVEATRGLALIDINPRFYGSLPLALACGVNLPAAWHATVTGEPPVDHDGYRIGVSYHWLEGDLLSAARASGRPLSASLRVLLRPPSHPRTGAVWAGDDPLPSGVFAVDLALGIARRRLRRQP